MKHIERISANLAQIFKEKRLKKGISHQKLADAAGLDRSTISRIESGERIPTVPVAMKIAEAMGESLSDLLKEAGEK